MDCTCYAIPVNNNNFKLLLIIAYNKIENKTKLCNISLIKNENIETFSKILEFLKKEYQFDPKIMKTDCSLAEIMSIRNVFPLCKNLICYFHIIHRCVKHLPQIRSKDVEIKTKANDLLTNIKLLLFVESLKIEDYFEKIKIKYKHTFKNFTNYFYKNYFKRFPFSEKIWNYSNYDFNDAMIDIINFIYNFFIIIFFQIKSNIILNN